MQVLTVTKQSSRNSRRETVVTKVVIGEEQTLNQRLWIGNSTFTLS